MFWGPGYPVANISDVTVTRNQKVAKKPLNRVLSFLLNNHVIEGMHQETCTIYVF